MAYCIGGGEGLTTITRILALFGSSDVVRCCASVVQSGLPDRSLCSRVTDVPRHFQTGRLGYS